MAVRGIGPANDRMFVSIDELKKLSISYEINNNKNKDYFENKWVSLKKRKNKRKKMGCLITN